MKDLLSSLKADIGQLFEGRKSVCLWLSGGMDSTLLLRVLLDTGKPFGLLRFDDGWNREQRRAVDRLIMSEKLMVFSYPPTASFLIANSREVSHVAGYAIDHAGTRALLVRDLIHDDGRCAFDVKIDLAPSPKAPIEYGVHIWGSRKGDRHWSQGRKQLVQGKTWTTGDKTFLAPLFDWTREQVAEALKTYGVEPAGTDSDIHACHRCLMGRKEVFCPKEKKMIRPVKWNRKQNLKILEQMLG